MVLVLSIVVIVVVLFVIFVVVRILVFIRLVVVGIVASVLNVDIAAMTKLSRLKVQIALLVQPIGSVSTIKSDL